MTARRCGSRSGAGGLVLDGDPGLLDHPDAVARADASVRCPNAGEVIVSATEGWEFADLGGRHHLGGGSHGSLVEGDSVVPILAVGLHGAAAPGAVVDVAPAILAHFGVEAPGVRARAGSVRRDAVVRGAPRRGWWSASSAGGGSRTSACSPRWSSVPREAFVPAPLADRAYDDAALPIGEEQTISQPYIVAAMCELLGLDGDRAGARRRHGLGLRGRRARRARRRGRLGRADPGPRGHAPERRSTRRGTPASRSGSATARSARRTGRPSPRSRSPPRRPACRRRSTSSSRWAAAWCFPSAVQRGQHLVRIVKTADGPERTAWLGCRFVPLVEG